MKLKTYLKRANIRPAEFARMTGASPSTVSRWLDGSRRPGAEQIFVIARATCGEVRFGDFYPKTERKGK